MWVEALLPYSLARRYYIGNDVQGGKWSSFPKLRPEVEKYIRQRSETIVVHVMWFAAPFLLFGLFALAIPPIIHLLNRRRYEVVDWGAMRFLQISEVTRRRIFIEEILLLLLRMGLLGLLVFGLASPWLQSEA